MPTLSAIAANTTPDLAGTYYGWLYYRTRGGMTGFSPVASVSIASGQGIQITLPTTCRKNGGDFLWIGFALSLVNDPLTSSTVATWPNYGSDGQTLRSLPDAITLTEDEHFARNAAVATRSSLPTGIAATNGQLRYVADESLILSWNALLDEWETANPQVFNHYVASSLDQGGADRDLSLVDDTSVFVFPDYTPSATAAIAGDAVPSLPVRYWIVNDTAAEIPQGTVVRLAIERDGFNADSLLAGRSTDVRYKGIVKVRFLGYVNIVTGELDTSGLSNVGVQYPYQGNEISSLRLDKPLPPSYAYALEVVAQFSWFHFANRLNFGSTITVYPYFEVGGARYAGILGRMLGDFIAPTEQRRRIVPDGPGLLPIALPGSGMVSGYEFENGGTDVVAGVQPNTAGQIVAIEAAGGNCFVQPAPLPSDYAQRAIVSTVDGTGKLSPWSAPLTITANKSLAISITIPNRIRPDYPDAIAGYSPCRPNALQVLVFLRVGGTAIYRQIVSLAPNITTLTLSISSLPASSVLPTVASDFGLFAIETAPIVTGDDPGGLAAGSYEVSAAFEFTSTITGISHDETLGCIAEFGRELAAATKVVEGWTAPTGTGRSRSIGDPDTANLQTVSRTLATLVEDLLQQGLLSG